MNAEFWASEVCEVKVKNVSFDKVSTRESSTVKRLAAILLEVHFKMRSQTKTEERKGKAY